jgi:hypothetical protein
VARDGVRDEPRWHTGPWSATGAGGCHGDGDAGADVGRDGDGVGDRHRLTDGDGNGVTDGDALAVRGDGVGV